jgi:hypothetical protein
MNCVLQAFNFSWTNSRAGSTDSFLTVTVVGDFFVVVTDTNNCVPIVLKLVWIISK